MKTLITFILTLLCSVSVLGQSIEIPEKSNKYINDYADIIPDEQEYELAAICHKQEKNSTAQIVVVTTNDVPDDYPIAEFSQELFEKWGIGQAGVDNGVLIVVFPNQRQSRVHVGYGLEGALTDGYTKTAQRENLNPHFKVGDYLGGLKLLLIDISQRIDPEAIAHRAELARIQEQKRAEAISSFWNWTIGIVLTGLLIWLIVYVYLKKKREEEERLREEEAERKRKEYQEAERKRAEERRIEKEKKYKQDVRQQLRQLKTLYESKKTFMRNLVNANFLDAVDVSQKLLLFEKEMPSDLSENSDLVAAESLKKSCDNLLVKINNLTEGLEKKWEIKNFAEISLKECDRILNEEKERLKKLQYKISQLNTLHGEKIWEYPIAFFNFNPSTSNLNTNWTKIVNALSYHVKATTEAIAKGDFTQAKVHAVDANATAVNLDDIDLEICSKDKQIADADNFIKKTMLTLTAQLSEATKLANDPIVASQIDLKTNYTKHVNSINLKNFTDVNICVLDRKKLLVDFIKYIEETKSTANQHIAAYKAKLEKEAEEKRRRKRREEEAEEEERRRRRREDEENSYRASSSSYSSSSSSYDSGSSNSSSDFGGGSSGGGGSDNSW